MSFNLETLRKNLTATVRHHLNYVTSSYYQPESTNGAVSAVCLIEQAIAENS